MTKKQKDALKLCTVVNHPVVLHKLSMLRDKNTTSLSFRLILEEISQYLVYEATRNLKLKKAKVVTPLEKTETQVVAEGVVIVPIMRAGLGMMNGMLRIIPFARVGHIGIYRDKFIKNTVEYYFRIPKDCRSQRVLLLDPLLATGDTAVAAIERLKQYGVGPITCLSILAAPEGVLKLKSQHPDVEILTVSLERELNKSGYILPGLGDAGDRLYDTL